MREKVYIESTIVSYLVARPSRDLVIAAQQQLTQEWWWKMRAAYACFTSAEVIMECSRGEAAMASLRIAALQGISIVKMSAEVYLMAQDFLKSGALPSNMGSDALHLAAAAVAEADFLLTWNCRHLANANILRRLEREAIRLGRALPIVCTPMEMIGDH